MNTQTEFRKTARFEHKTTLMVSDEDQKYFSYAQMLNYSAGGMCFGSDVAFKPGARVSVRMEKPLSKTAPKAFRGIVRWCKESAEEEAKYYFGVGIQYL